MYKTPQYKIKNGDKMIAQAYDAPTAARIALMFNAEISYSNRCIVWRGNKEEMLILAYDANSIERISNVINRRVKEYWAGQQLRSKKKWDDLQTEIQDNNRQIMEAK